MYRSFRSENAPRIDPENGRPAIENIANFVRIINFIPGH